MFPQPSCCAWWRPPVQALALGLGAFIAVPLGLPLLHQCQAAAEVSLVAPCAPVAELSHSTERHPGGESIRVAPVSASTSGSRVVTPGTGELVFTGYAPTVQVRS